MKPFSQFTYTRNPAEIDATVDAVYTSEMSSGDILLNQIPREALAELITNNANLRGILQGYIAEYHLKQHLEQIPGVTNVQKIPDQSRKKGDFSFDYQGRELTVEAKSISTGSGKEEFLEGGLSGVVKVSSSDSLILEDGRRTNCLPPGMFDILAISTYGMLGEWEFYFIHSRYLPTSVEYPGRLQSSFRLNIHTTPCLHKDLSLVLQDLE